jgi:hypothetical protein
MMSKLIFLLATVVVAIGVYVTYSPQLSHAQQHVFAHGEEPVTLSIRQNDFALCTDPFYVGIYNLTVTVFAVGAENVDLANYQQQLFNFIRTSDTFSEEDREAFVEHVADIPRQLVEIIREDATVLDSCSNFSVALVGAP